MSTLMLAKEYEGKIIITSKLNYLKLIKDKLDNKRRKLFRETCFGSWLDIMFFDHEPHMIDYMLKKQCRVNDSRYDMPLTYYVNGCGLHFGRREFSLITGFRFGTVSFSLYSTGEMEFRNRVFPNKVGVPITNLDVFSVIEDEEYFNKISDLDAVRLCLLLCLEVIFMGQLFVKEIDDSLLRLVDSLESWNAFPWGEHIWMRLYDGIMNVVSNHKDEHLEGLHKSRNYVPTYTVAGFVWAFKVWILESFERSNQWWNKDTRVIPRGIRWSRKSLFKRSDFCNLFAKDSKIIFDLIPTVDEYHTDWLTTNIAFFQQYVPRKPTRQPDIYDAYLQKLSARRTRNTISEILTKPTNNAVRSKISNVKDRVIKELNSRTFKLEAIIQVIVAKRKDGTAVQTLEFSDEFSHLGADFCEELNKIYLELFESPVGYSLGTPLDVDTQDEIDEEYLLLEEFRMRVEDDERLLLEEERRIVEEERVWSEKQKLRKIEEERARAQQERFDAEKKKRSYAIMNSDHMKRAMARCLPTKRSQMVGVRSGSWLQVCAKFQKKQDSYRLVEPDLTELLKSVKPWTEDLTRINKSIDHIWISDDLDLFLGGPGNLLCRFPWSKVVSVDRRFWESLVCLDPPRQGYLMDEHIDLWVEYMWNVHPQDANWAMVSVYFVQLLLQKTMPLWYANGENYPITWTEVDKVFMPINEPGVHYFLAVFDIKSGVVTFYDSANSSDVECRPWYIKMRTCLQDRLPEVLELLDVFAKKGIDKSTYNITFENAENVPKQGGVFGDCGVWVCIFLYRLAHGISLDVEDPIQTALAYRERMSRFYFNHKVV